MKGAKRNYIFIALALAIITYYQARSYNVMGQIIDSCQVEDSTIALKKIIPIDWETLYIVSGPENSEHFYQSFQLTGNKNVTRENEISLYFILKNKSVYIENYNENSKIRVGITSIDDPYIEFQATRASETKMKGSRVVAIYGNKEILRFPLFDQLFDPCIPTPTEQN